MSRALRLTEAEYAAIRSRQVSARSHNSTELAGSGERAISQRPATRNGTCGASAGTDAPGARGSPSKPSKFGNRKIDGYASKRERDRAAELKLMEQAGRIRDLREQVEYVLIPKQDGERACKYRADFVYWEFTDRGWREIVEDCKGYRTEVYRLKRKLMLFLRGVKVRET